MSVINITVMVHDWVFPGSLTSARLEILHRPKITSVTSGNQTQNPLSQIRYDNLIRPWQIHFWLFFIVFNNFLVSWLSYQYYWFIYHNTNQSVVMLTPQPWVSSRVAITTILKVFGMTRPGIESMTSQTDRRHLFWCVNKVLFRVI